MTVSQVFLYVNTVNDQPSATEIDITASMGSTGGVYTYDVGQSYATRFYWVKLVDGSGNETLETLGAYTTQDVTAPLISSFTVSAGSTAQSEIDVAIISSDNNATGFPETLYLWVSDTQTTQPTATEIKANGIALPGTTTAYTRTNLSPGTTYYAWLLARDFAGNESGVQASTPANLTTAADVIPPSLDSFSLDPTTGFEETRVDITLSFSDIVA